MYSAQPVRIETAAGKWIDGVVAGFPSICNPAEPIRRKPPDIENIYVDIGATNAAEVRKAGVDILDPIVINRRLMNLAIHRTGRSFHRRSFRRSRAPGIAEPH